MFDRSSVAMYNWMLANSETGLWSRYNDISGEHSLNLGHSTHNLGNHIDIFHYFTIDSSSGTNNFNAFVAAVTSHSIDKIKAWIEIHRKNFDQLNADSNVVQILTHRGVANASKNFKNNWLMILFETGRIKSLDINLKLPEWKSPSKIRWVSDHTHHIHIQIKSS